MGEGVSEFVGVLREDEERVAGRSRSPMPPTQAAIRWSLPLTRPLTLADRRWPERSFAHVGQPREHGAQTVEQGQQRQDLRLGGEVEYQHALQSGRRLARLAAGTAKAAQASDTLANPSRVCRLALRSILPAQSGTRAA